MLQIKSSYEQRYFDDISTTHVYVKEMPSLDEIRDHFKAQIEQLDSWLDKELEKLKWYQWVKIHQVKSLGRYLLKVEVMDFKLRLNQCKEHTNA